MAQGGSYGAGGEVVSWGDRLSVALFVVVFIGLFYWILIAIGSHL